MSHRNPNLRSEVIKDIRVLCTHIFEGGHQCASPALRGETFRFPLSAQLIGISLVSFTELALYS